MMKPKSKRPLAVWSTAAFTAFVISLSPVGTYAAHAATVTEVKGRLVRFHPCKLLRRQAGIRRFLPVGGL